MVKPTFADYVDLLCTLFERFWQHEAAPPHRGRPFVYQHKALIVFFLVMQRRRTFRFKAQRRRLVQHPEMRKVFGLDDVPDRTTLSRRYTALYDVLQDCIAFLGAYAEDLDPRFRSDDLYTDKSLFKAQGPVWHQSDRLAGRIPENLRHLDTDGSWSTSGYQGWVYGYGFHLVDNRVGFPKLAQALGATGPQKQLPMQRLDNVRTCLTRATLTVQVAMIANSIWGLPLRNILTIAAAFT